MSETENVRFWKKHKKGLIIAGSITGVLLAIVIGCLIYLGIYYHATPEALLACKDTEEYTFTETDYGMVFQPKEPVAGLIFYPGGKVENTAYAPLMAEFARHDILCVLVEMPFRLAVFDPGAADGIQERFLTVSRWFIGGHSLGGAMAASYVSDHAKEYEGLLLLGAYSTADLTDSSLRVLSVYGENDGVLNKSKYTSNRSNLPKAFREVVITGGNHAGFGCYGEQDGDGKASVSGEVQRAQTVDAFLQFFLSANT